MAFTPEPGTFYKIEDLTEVATKHTFRKWIKSGKLKASLVGREYIISGEDLRLFLSGGSAHQTSPKRKKRTKGAKGKK